MRVFVKIGLVVACLVAGQSAAFAQVSLAGVVTDNSGAVLPGVTVEASSPALIERSAPRRLMAAGVIDLRACSPASTPSRSRCLVSRRRSATASC